MDRPTTSESVSFLPFSPFMNKIKHRTVPKAVQPERFTKDYTRWWLAIMDAKESERNVIEEAQRSILEQLPLREAELYKLQRDFIPNRSLVYKAPEMCFGWVIAVDEIKALAKIKGVEVSYGRRLVKVLPGDPGYSDAEDGEPDGEGVLIEKQVFWPSSTMSDLFQKAVQELGLNKNLKNLRATAGIFDVHPVMNDFISGPVEDDPALFISIYTNLELMPSRKHLIPSQCDIKKVQDWFGLSDREAGWWFSQSCHLPMTWSDWKYWNGN